MKTTPLSAPPTPGTALLRDSHSPHFLQTFTSAAIWASTGAAAAAIAARASQPEGLSGASVGRVPGSGALADAPAARGTGLPNRSDSSATSVTEGAADAAAGAVAAGAAETRGRGEPARA